MIKRCPRCNQVIYFGPSSEYRAKEVKCDCGWKYMRKRIRQWKN